MATSTIKRDMSVTSKSIASGETFSANGIKDYTIDLTDYGNSVVVDIFAYNATVGTQYINIVRTGDNKYRISSSVAQTVSFTALILRL